MKAKYLLIISVVGFLTIKSAPVFSQTASPVTTNQVQQKHRPYEPSKPVIGKDGQVVKTFAPVAKPSANVPPPPPAHVQPTPKHPIYVPIKPTSDGKGSVTPPTTYKATPLSLHAPTTTNVQPTPKHRIYAPTNPALGGKKIVTTNTTSATISQNK